MNDYEISIDQLLPDVTSSDIVFYSDDRNVPFIEFEVKNNSSIEYSEIEAQLRFYDANDEFIGVESGE